MELNRWRADISLVNVTTVTQRQVTIISTGKFSKEGKSNQNQTIKPPKQRPDWWSFSNTSHCLNLKFKPITSQTRNAGIVDSTHNSKSDFELKSERSKSLRRTDLMLVHCSQNKRTLSGRPYAILRTGFARRRSKHKITIETLAGSATDNGRYLPNWQTNLVIILHCL